MTIPTNELMSINDAVAKGITKLRSPKWANPMDHIEISIIPAHSRFNPSDVNLIGPWVKLWSPTNAIVGVPDPSEHIVTLFNLDNKGYVPFVGEYQGGSLCSTGESS